MWIWGGVHAIQPTTGLRVGSEAREVTSSVRGLHLHCDSLTFMDFVSFQVPQGEEDP